jgi:ketosteroid isomerase-like protein
MTRTNVEVVERFFELPPDDELAALVDPGIVICDYDLPDAGEYHGYDGLARYTAQWEEAFHDWAWDLEETLEAGDRVAALFTIRARSAAGLETRRRNGIVFTLRDSRVVRFQYFTSPEQARAAVGIPSSSG